MTTEADPEDHVHFGDPLRFVGDGAAAQARMRSLLCGMPRVTVIRDEPGYLHVTFTSRIMRYVDDVELVFRPEGEIQYRSASRLGWGDGGANRSRMENIARAWRSQG